MEGGEKREGCTHKAVAGMGTTWFLPPGGARGTGAWPSVLEAQF